MLKNLGNLGLWTVLAVMAMPGAAHAAGELPYGGKFDLKIVAHTHPVDGSISLLGTFEGHATSLGNLSGWVRYDLDMTTGTFEGEVIKAVANGDLIFETVTGHFTDATMSIAVGELTIDGGTGRFENAVGSGEFVSVFGSATEASVKFNGTWSYDAASRAGNPPAGSDDFDVLGQVIFRNIQASLQSGEPAPYAGVGASRLTGLNVQTGSILPTSQLAPVAGTPGAFQFTGRTGPHPGLGTNVHVISTAKGDIFCEWVALFTIQFDAGGDAVFSGDGSFTVIGGTGHYRKASGTFRTLFKTKAIKLGTDTAVADVTQEGTIAR